MVRFTVRTVLSNREPPRCVASIFVAVTAAVAHIRPSNFDAHDLPTSNRDPRFARPHTRDDLFTGVDGRTKLALIVG